MTRKHFEAIAASFANELPNMACRQESPVYECAYQHMRCVALNLCDAFKRENPVFDEARFMTACGFIRHG